MSEAIIAHGTLLQHGDGVSSEAFTTVPEVTKLSGPSVKATLLDCTSHDSSDGFKEYLPGLLDGDNVTAEVNWRPSNTVHKALRVDSYAKTLRNFQVIYPDDTDNTCAIATYITDIVPKSDAGVILTAALTLKVTGAPQWS
jgi:hypothetical protein